MNRLLPPPTSNLESNKSAKAVDLIFENEEGEEESPNFIPCINVFISYGLKRRMDADDYCVSKEEEARRRRRIRKGWPKGKEMKENSAATMGR